MDIKKWSPDSVLDCIIVRIGFWSVGRVKFCKRVVWILPILWASLVWIPAFRGYIRGQELLWAWIGLESASDRAKWSLCRVTYGHSRNVDSIARMNPAIVHSYLRREMSQPSLHALLLTMLPGLLRPLPYTRWRSVGIEFRSLPPSRNNTNISTGSGWQQILLNPIPPLLASHWVGGVPPVCWLVLWVTNPIYMLLY